MAPERSDLALPDFFRVRQRFDGPRVEDVPAAVRETLESLDLGTRVRRGETVGSPIDPAGLTEVDVRVHEAWSEVMARHVYPNRVLRDRAVRRRTDAGQPIAFHQDDSLRDRGGARPVDHGGASQCGRLRRGRGSQPERASDRRQGRHHR